MKNHLAMLAVLIIVIITAMSSFAQEPASESTDQPDLKKFGLGLHVEQFKMQDVLSSTFVPVNKLIITISPSNKWRLEPSIGFSKSKDEFSDTGFTNTQTLTGFYIGLGGFGMYQVGATNIYFGIRLENAKITNESKYLPSSGPSNTSTTETSRFMIGPVIGAEFFFAKHFSFGGEFALKNYSSKTTSTGTNNPNPSGEDKSNFFSTETGLLLRFYF